MTTRAGQRAALDFAPRGCTRLPLMVQTLDVIGAEEAAVLLGCTRWTVQRLTARGELHPVLETPNGRLYLRREVLALADARAYAKAHRRKP